MGKGKQHDQSMPKNSKKLENNKMGESRQSNSPLKENPESNPHSKVHAGLQNSKPNFGLDEIDSFGHEF